MAIPTIKLDDFTTQNNTSVFYIESIEDTRNIPLHLPYRTAYYGLGLVLEGEASLRVNLETYQIHKNSFIYLAPETIKQWLHRSPQLKTITVFFTKEFYTSHFQKAQSLDQFQFMDFDAQHVHQLSAANAKNLGKILNEIKAKINSKSLYKYPMVANLLALLMFEFAGIYSGTLSDSTHKKSRAYFIHEDFKKLVARYYTQERRLQFYAEKLNITPKHLTESIKAETGRSASEWIDEMVVLEAKVLLQDASLSIAHITEQLNFVDQSTFGKFFKNITGTAPLVYRQTT
jgi:AraC family transcriptional regulator, transcriptional activator of pobA